MSLIVNINTGSLADGDSVSPVVVSDSLTPWAVAHQAKTTGVGCYFLLQGIFLTKGSRTGLQVIFNCIFKEN